MEDDSPVSHVRNGVSSAFCGKPHLQFFCSDACCLRYLKARNMDEGKAIKLLQETLSWCVFVVEFDHAIFRLHGCNMPARTFWAVLCREQSSAKTAGPSGCPEHATMMWPRQQS
jgi:hypothetical protein